MRRFLLPILFIASPGITFLLVTTIGRDFTNGRAPVPELLFQYAEVILPFIEGYGLELPKAHEYLDQNYGWCSKYKPIVKKIILPAPKPAPVVLSPPAAAPVTPSAATGAALPATSGKAPQTPPAPATPPIAVVALAPVVPPPPPKFIPPENLHNVNYATSIELPGGMELYCKDIEQDSISLVNTSQNPESIEIQRFLKKPLLILPDSGNIDVVARDKYAFYLRTRIGDLLIQGAAPAKMNIFSEQMHLNIVSKAGKVLVTSFRVNNDPRVVIPIKLLSQPGSFIRWDLEPELKDGQFSEISTDGPLKTK